MYIYTLYNASVWVLYTDNNEAPTGISFLRLRTLSRDNISNVSSD